MTAAPETRLRPALADAARDARSSWRRRHTVWSVVFVAAALVPIVVSSPIRLQSWASGLYIALAAVGLNFAVGLGGLPSLGQGAFVGAGAFTTAALSGYFCGIFGWFFGAMMGGFGGARTAASRGGYI